VSDPFIGEIRMLASDFAPRGWALCDGQLMTIAQNTQLFSLLGTQYGGNGVTTFALPDLRGRLALHRGQGPGLTDRPQGASFGVEAVTLTESQVPPHSHAVTARTDPATATAPAGATFARSRVAAYAKTGDLVPLATQALPADGGGGAVQPHDNLMPSLCVTHVIALQGIFPARGN
jgi:microcystin-dependent protein